MKISNTVTEEDLPTDILAKGVSDISKPTNTWENNITIEDVADIRSGNGFPKKYQGRSQGELPFFKVGDISRNWQSGQITLTKGEHYLTRAESKEIRAKTLPQGSIVFAKIGAAVALNRRAILGCEALVDNNVMALVPSEATTSRFLFYYMCQVDLGASTRGGAVPSLRKGDVGNLEILLPPLPEQRRIVARIEALFSRLDAGVAALKKAKAQLQRYRQSVLAAAVTGELTQAWRKQNPDVEPAEKLLERILDERRKQWTGRRKYKEPIAPAVKGLPEIPVSWTWSSPAQLSAPEDYSLGIGPFGSNLKVSDYTDAGVPLVFVRHIRANDYDLTPKFVSEEKASELKAHSVDPGDLLITKMGEPPGDAALYPESRPHAIITADCIKLRLTNLIISKSFFVDAINSELVAKQIAPITRGVAQKKISLDRFRDIALPLPPLAEQQQIVAEVETRITAIDQLEAELDRQLTRSNRLRQSTLASAFPGQL